MEDKIDGILIKLSNYISPHSIETLRLNLTLEK
jgi:hypothetical protein